MKRKKELVDLKHIKKSNKFYVNELLRKSNDLEINNLPNNLDLTHKDLISNAKLDHVEMILSEAEYNLYIKKNYRLFNFFKETSFLAIIYFMSFVFLLALSFYADDVDHILLPTMIAFPIVVISFSLLEIDDYDRLSSYRKAIKKMNKKSIKKK